MEKVHNWEYVKSKSRGRRSAAQRKAADGARASENCAVAVDADHSRPALATSHRPATAPTTGGDFLLFDDQEDAVGEDDDPHCLQYGGTDNAESYLPWTSPTTRLRDNELLIERFSQTYNGAQGNANAIPSTLGAGMDPVLPDLVLPGARYYPQGDDGNANAVAIKVESPVKSLDTASPTKRKYQLFKDRSPQQNSTPASTQAREPNRGREAGAGQGPSISLGYRPSVKRGDGSDGNGSRPKRAKLDPARDFTDTTMPDIFRHAHPDIYDRNRSDKYSPCHTVHREISTLIRHLSRPAHRLSVTGRAISSFDIEDPDFKHPRVGVCRNCWQTFHERSDFDSHLSSPCQRVSKGKKEKWRVLYESFTPLAAGPNTQTGGELCGRPAEHPNDALSPAGIGNQEAARTPSTSVPSPVSPQLANPTPVGSGVERFVSADEHDRLQREHEALRERHQQLERMAQALLIKQLFQESMNLTTAAGPAVKPPLPIASSEKDCPATSAAASDRDNLVQHMNSHSTDVDVHAFMEEMEDARQSLSRMNSGLSTASRSTIHRVPPSPPSRHADLPGFPSGDGETGRHAPLPSIPDSGYGTENRRGSLGDLAAAGAGQQPATPGSLIPPCTAESAAGGDGNNKDKAGGEAVLWGESPLQQTPRGYNGTLSPPHHGQPSFMTEHDMADMADYADDFYNIFYQDNMLHSRSSPPGFTFENPSQVE
ncbi:hypothetical protein MYCTH_2304236 [Thermothelomyces thermophilus ATCC 42464]|uniref:C2H2-type domain-containing protein n=1 Tax=Thermothelomyces thermophilus (strain ATCC 42464 / BCRC 31852 / DSM 1799) TaxID=573729 RepID=G2QED2_THET4|nr:uncharacterized protein MYCTH_2304236 [Thermothelomyces thermophilus ATCC 42464]AEO57715.1 hypothetical protein MYCTH_2304236 [Thermothelomyces thermophilus ATCC 42464]